MFKRTTFESVVGRCTIISSCLVASCNTRFYSHFNQPIKGSYRLAIKRLDKLEQGHSHDKDLN